MARKSKLNAVNEMLRAIQEEPVSALDTGGTSEEAAAERILDAVSTRVQSSGWPENFERAVAYIPVDVGGSVYEISLGNNVLAIKAGGANPHRNLVMRSGKVYDADNHTFNFGSSSAIHLDTTTELDFGNCSPVLQERILAEAIRDYILNRKGSTAAYQIYSYELANRDARTPRVSPEHSDAMHNFPYAPPQSDRSENQR